MLNATDNTAADGKPGSNIKNHVANLPLKSADLLHVAETVNTAWAANSFVALPWKSQADFSADVAAFKAALQQRNTQGSKRRQQSRQLQNLHREINKAVPFVKAYILEKFGPKAGKVHYAEFGLVRRGRNYELSRDNQKCKDALRMMTDAIHANGFDAKTYGSVFWTDIKERYDTALTAATIGAGSVSAHISEMAVLRSNLRKVLSSLLLLLRAYYPDTFKQVRREWGFQKESY